jgi:hypothetical protein
MAAAAEADGVPALVIGDHEQQIWRPARCGRHGRGQAGADEQGEQREKDRFHLGKGAFLGIRDSVTGRFVPYVLPLAKQ